MNEAEAANPILYKVANNIATITLNRPEKLNAFNHEMIERWIESLESARGDNSVRVIIVTGAGRAFCSGGDVDNMGAGNEMTPLEIKNNLRDGVQRIPELLSRIDKPVIAAINGICAGAGLDLALMCDLRFAASSARMAETYSRVGLVPGAGGAYFLPRLVGIAKALEMFWGAEFVDADEALRIGLVNRVMDDEKLMEQTMAFAGRVARAPPLSVQLIKRAVYQCAELDLAASLDLISSHMSVARSSEDHLEAVAAFREKREGEYRGR